MYWAACTAPSCTVIRSDRGKKRPKRSTKNYCSHHGENASHTTKVCDTLKAKGQARPKFSKKDFKKKSKEFNLIKKKASLEKAKYLKYKNLNKASKKKSPVILELSESDSSSSEEEDSSSEEENFMNYDSESGESEKSSDDSDTEEEA